MNCAMESDRAARIAGYLLWGKTIAQTTDKCQPLLMPDRIYYTAIISAFGSGNTGSKCRTIICSGRNPKDS